MRWLQGPVPALLAGEHHFSDSRTNTHPKSMHPNMPPLRRGHTRRIADNMIGLDIGKLHVGNRMGHNPSGRYGGYER